MRIAVAIAVLTVLGAASASAPARAQELSGIPCDAFAKNAEGQWYATRNADISGTGHLMRIQQGSVLRPGAAIMGLDLAEILDRQCPVTAAPEPEAPISGPASAGPAGGVPLSHYADANGNIEVRTLTCAHLNAASPAEADLLLAWYSGWYNGSAKRRGINLARVRYALRSVGDYCRRNPDKNLVQVMDLMLK